MDLQTSLDTLWQINSFQVPNNDVDQSSRGEGLNFEMWISLWASLELLDQCSELIEEFREYNFD